MLNILTAFAGAILGLATVWFGLSFHIGPWFITGSWGAAASAVTGAAVALFLKYAVGKEYGWH